MIPITPLIKKRVKLRYVLSLLFLFIVITVVIDVVRISKYDVKPRRPKNKISSHQDRIYRDLVNGLSVDWRDLDGTLEYIKGEYDCADFRMVNLVRILYDYDEQIPQPTMEKIKTVLLNFRYWWDEPGENSMCYWSENHQILFAAAEYLIGQKFQKEVFPNSELTGKQHMEKARVRILDWLEMRWNYGFIEYYSGVYYKEDIGPLINLIDYALDEELVTKAKIILDVLFYDVACQNIHGMFVSTSGRAYKGNRVGRNQNLGGLTRFYWGDGEKSDTGMTYGAMVTKNYFLPAVLVDIARDTSTVIIKQSNGLDLSELKSEGYYGTDNRSMMMQWGMEAFTNPLIIRNSLAHIRNNNMFSNEFIADFRMLDFTLLNWLHLEPLLVRILNPQTNGVAIQKGNTYTYKTNDYSMYTSQAYHPGTYGDQQHVFGMNIKNHFSIFHNHPALEKDVKNQSPNYWVGYGHLPHAVQDQNINLSIYNLPRKKGIMEMALLDYTRAHFPGERFDTTVVHGRYAFGQKEETYCALIGATDFRFRDAAHDDLIQDGRQTYWITEAGSKQEDGSFETFIKRIQKNKVHFDPSKLLLTYQSHGKTYELNFGGAFKVDGHIIHTNYGRYDSPYAQVAKKARTITFEFNGQTLFLDFSNGIRTCSSR